MSGRAATTNIIPGKYALAVGQADMPAPPGWSWLELLQIARLESGHTPSRSRPEYWDGDIPWIGIRDARAHHGETIYETQQSVTQAGIDNSAARVLPAKTVCLSRTASVGYVVVMGREMATSQDFVNWICSPALEPRFLQKLLITEKDSLLRFSKGSTHSTIYYPEVKAFHICLPPLNEQKRIVAKIDELTARSRRAKQALDAVPPLLDKLRQSILAAAFRGDLTADWRAKNPNVEPADQLLARIRTERRARWEAAELAKMQAKGKVPRDDRWKKKYQEPKPLETPGPTELPLGWTWAAWREIGLSQNGRPFPSRDYQSEGIRLLRPGNLHVSGTVQWTAENTRCLPHRHAEENKDLLVGPGEIIMNLTAQSLKDQFLGRVCLTGPGEQSLLNQRLARLTPIVLSAELVMWLFKSPLVRSYIDALNTGTLIQHIFASQVDGFALPVPPLAEQEVILARLKTAMRSIDMVAREVAASLQTQSSLDQSILAKAFRGELVPQDPTDEPAAALLERIRAARESTPKKPKPRRARKASTPAPTRKPTQQLPLALTPSSIESAVFPALWLRGPLDKDTAVRTLALHLREAGLVSFKRLRADGPLYAQLLAAIESAVKSGHLDRPRRGQVRARKPHASAYSSEDWRAILLASLGAEPMHREDAIRQAAEWARDNLGLEFKRLRSDGHIATGLRSAITSAIRRRLLERDGPRRIKLADG